MLTRDDQLTLTTTQAVMTLGLDLAKHAMEGHGVAATWLRDLSAFHAAELVKRLERMLPLDGGDTLVVTNTIISMLLTTAVGTANAMATLTGASRPAARCPRCGHEDV